MTVVIFSLNDRRQFGPSLGLEIGNKHPPTQLPLFIYQPPLGAGGESHFVGVNCLCHTVPPKMVSAVLRWPGRVPGLYWHRRPGCNVVPRSLKKGDVGMPGAKPPPGVRAPRGEAPGFKCGAAAPLCKHGAVIRLGCLVKLRVL